MQLEVWHPSKHWWPFASLASSFIKDLLHGLLGIITMSVLPPGQKTTKRQAQEEKTQGMK